MTTATIEGALPTRPSPWASRLAVTAVHFFVMVLFLVNMRENTWAAILGFLLIHVYSMVVLRYWSNMERSTAGDTAIVALTLEYVLVALLFWDSFSAWPWSTFFGLVLIQLCAFSAVRFWKGLSKAPPSAWFGLVVILLYVMIAATAPIINVIAINLAYLVVGVVIVEVVFVYPGLGQLLVDSVSKRDIPVVQASGLIFAAAYILLNLTADVLSIMTNPRLMHPR